MKVDIGNADAVEVTVSEQGEMVFSSVEGERVTTFIIPDGTSIGDAFQIVLAGMPRHINPTARPWWVEADDSVLQVMLLDHYALPRSTQRPPRWGDGSTTRPIETSRAAAQKKATKKAAAEPKEEEA